MADLHKQPKAHRISPLPKMKSEVRAVEVVAEPTLAVDPIQLQVLDKVLVDQVMEQVLVKALDKD